MTANLDMSTQRTAPSMDEAESIPLPALEEVKFAVMKLKNNRLSGPDGLNAELKERDKMCLVHRLWKLIEKMWKEEIHISVGGKAKMYTSYKKGRPNDVQKLMWYFFSEHSI
jgi:hypothetical protein